MSNYRPGGHSIELNLLHVAEELGEVSRAVRDKRHGEGSDEDIIEECVDLVITALATYGCTKAGTSTFLELFKEKCQKWEDNVRNRIQQDSQ